MEDKDGRLCGIFEQNLGKSPPETPCKCENEGLKWLKLYSTEYTHDLHAMLGGTRRYLNITAFFILLLWPWGSGHHRFSHGSHSDRGNHVCGAYCHANRDDYDGNWGVLQGLAKSTITWHVTQLEWPTCSFDAESPVIHNTKGIAFASTYTYMHVSGTYAPRMCNIRSNGRQNYPGIFPSKTNSKSLRKSKKIFYLFHIQKIFSNAKTFLHQ